MAASDRPIRPRRRLYPTRRDHLRALWEERLRRSAEAEEGDSRPMLDDAAQRAASHRGSALRNSTQRND
jgi:hypothetical protein